MADYVRMEDDGPPHAVVSPSLLPPGSVSSSASPSSSSVPVSIPDDPSMIPHSSPPVHPHVLFSRLLSFHERPACNRAMFFLYPTFILFLALFMFSVGVAERSAAHASQLSLWLIVASVLLMLLALLLLVILTSLLSPHCAHLSPLTLPLLLCSLLVHSALTFCWFIVGNVWFSLASANTSPQLTRTVFWVLIFMYGQLLLQPVVSMVDWSVRRGCQCIRRSEEGRRDEEERERAIAWAPPPAAGAAAGAQEAAQAGAQYI